MEYPRLQKCMGHSTRRQSSWNHHRRKMESMGNKPKSWVEKKNCEIEIKHRMEQAKIIWNKNTSGIFSHRSAYEALKAKDSVKPWASTVWGKWVVTKHASLHGKLCQIAFRRNRLVNKKVITSSQCFFYAQCRENSKHLFFDCTYSKKSGRSLKPKLGYQDQSQH